MDDVAQAIRAMDTEFVANVRAGNVERLVSAFYADDARVLPPNSPPVEGKAAIIALWKTVLASGVSGLDLNTTHVEASGDLAYGVGAYHMKMGESETAGKYVVVYRRRGGQWRAVADMFSPNS